MCGEIENDTHGITKYIILLAGHEHHGKPGVNARPEGSARAVSKPEQKGQGRLTAIVPGRWHPRQKKELVQVIRGGQIATLSA